MISQVYPKLSERREMLRREAERVVGNDPPGSEPTGDGTPPVFPPETLMCFSPIRDGPIPNPHQPLPVSILVARMPIGGRVVTAITRQWLPGDSARCRLCPAGRCGAHEDVCLLLFDREIPDAEVPLVEHQAGEVVEPREAPLRLFGR
jgi:hypothetical protein